MKTSKSSTELPTNKKLNFWANQGVIIKNDYRQKAINSTNEIQTY